MGAWWATSMPAARGPSHAPCVQAQRWPVRWPLGHRRFRRGSRSGPNGRLEPGTGEGPAAVYVRDKAIRVEWQLYELDNGVFERCPPKDESRRTVAVPGWRAELLRNHVAGTRPAPCARAAVGITVSANAQPKEAPPGERSDQCRRAERSRHRGVWGGEAPRWGASEASAKDPRPTREKGPTL
jgi:hypothetical protein